MLLTIVEESLPISLNSFGFVWEDVGGGEGGVTALRIELDSGGKVVKWRWTSLPILL